VINRRRTDHVKSWAEFEFLPGVLETLAALNASGQQVVVITNQAVVGRGLLAEASLMGIHRRMLETISAAGGRVAAIYACLHRPEAGCDCRKPRTELFHRAGADLGINLRDSVVVGDAPSDIEAARALGCPSILIANTDQLQVGTVPTADSLAAAVAMFPSLAAEVAC
jgi:D-glycero-D-manno-heptose 1,7-bisphosphate phosphatase